MARAKAKYDLVAEDKSGKAIRSFKNGLKDATSSIRKAGGAAIGAGVAGFAVMAKQAIDAGDRIQKLSIQTGASTEFLSEMRFVASQAGTDMETVAKSVGKMQRNLKEAADGTQAQAEAFAELGLDVDALLKLKPDQQFEKIGLALKGVENETTRAALAQQIFGRSGLALLPIFDNGAEGLAKMRAEARELGLSMSRDAADGAAAANDAFDKLGRTFQGVTESLTLEFAPGLAKVVSGFQTAVIPVLSSVLGFLGRIIDAAAGLAAAGVQFASGNFSGAGAIFGEVIDNLFGGGNAANDPKSKQVQTDLVQGIKEIARNTRNPVAVAG